MTKEQLLNHYRNLYQVVKRDKDEIERELEEFKMLSSMQQDIVNNLNKRINILKHNNDLLENNLRGFTKFCDFGKGNSMSKTVKVVIR